MRCSGASRTSATGQRCFALPDRSQRHAQVCRHQNHPIRRLVRNAFQQQGRKARAMGVTLGTEFDFNAGAQVGGQHLGIPGIEGAPPAGGMLRDNTHMQVHTYPPMTLFTRI